MQAQVLGQRELEHEPTPLAVFGDVPDASLDALARAAVADVATADGDRPRLGPAQPRDRLDQLGLAVPVDAGDAHDLAGADVERDASHGLEVTVVPDPQIAHLEHRPLGVCRRLFDPQQHLAPDHQLGQPLLGRVCAWHGLDRPAAAQHRDPVGQLEHLAELVGDEDDRGAHVLSKRAQDPEEVGRLLRREHGGRLVQDQDARISVERLDDLDPLLLANRELLDPGIGIHPEAEMLGHCAHARTSSGQVEEGAAVRLRREHHVFGHGHHRDQHEVLVDHADPRLDRVSGGVDPDRLPANRISPASGW